MMMKKKIMAIFFASIIGVVPILASPLVIRNKANSNDSIYELANFEWPTTEYGWSYIQDEAYTKAQVSMNNLMTWLNDNSYKAKDSDEWAALQQMICDHFASTDDFQRYIVYQLRRILAQEFLYSINSKENKMPDQNDQENMLAMFLTNKTPSDAAYVIWDHANDNQIPLTNIKVSFDMRKIIADSFYYFNKFDPAFLTSIITTDILNVLNDETDINHFVSSDDTSDEINDVAEESKKLLEIIDYKNDFLTQILNIDLTNLNHNVNENINEFENHFEFVNYLGNRYKYDELMCTYINYFESFDSNVLTNDIKTKISEFKNKLDEEKTFVTDLCENKFNGSIKLADEEVFISNFIITNYNEKLDFKSTSAFTNINNYYEGEE